MVVVRRGVLVALCLVNWLAAYAAVVVLGGGVEDSKLVAVGVEGLYGLVDIEGGHGGREVVGW
jgi:hypothetical protein